MNAVNKFYYKTEHPAPILPSTLLILWTETKSASP